MKNRKIFLLIFLGLTLGVGTMPLTAQDVQAAPTEADAPNSLQQEQQHREKLKADYQAFMQAADTQLKEHNYVEVQRIYNVEALPILQELGLWAVDQGYTADFEQRNTVLYEVWAEYDAQRAAALAAEATTVAEYDEPIRILTMAIDMNPLESYKKTLKQYQMRRDSLEFRQAVDIYAQDSSFVERRSTTAKLLIEAKELIKLRQWQGARAKCEMVFERDPTNTEASRLLSQIYRQIDFAYKFRIEADMIEASIAVLNKWSNPIADRGKISDGNERVIVATPQERLEHFNRLSRIRVRDVDFEDADLQQAKGILERWCKQYDLTKGRPITVQLKLSTEARNTPDHITLKLSNATMTQILDYLAALTSKEWDISDNGDIYFGDMVARLEELEGSRGIVVPWGVIDNIAEKISADAENTDETDNADPYGDAAATPAANRNRSYTNELKAYLSKCGITFPEGSQIRYTKKTGRLYSFNTASNNADIAKIFHTLSLSTYTMISIETRFLEVKQARLEQLGFHWAITQSANVADNPLEGERGSTSTFSSSDINYISKAALNSLTPPSYNNGALNPQFAITLIPNAGPDNNFNLDLSITALDLNSDAVLLSSPKMTVRNGRPGKVNLNTIITMPVNYDPPTLENGDGYNSQSMSVTPPMYSEWLRLEEFFGINLEVTPSCLPDDRIEVDLTTDINDLSGWDQYNVPIMVPGADQIDYQVLRYPVVAQRAFHTKVQVIDGETIVLGGILKDQEICSDYAYPILSELPLVGRLFKDIRTEYERTNLLIFLTAKTLRPDGTAVKQQNADSIEPVGR